MPNGAVAPLKTIPFRLRKRGPSMKRTSLLSSLFIAGIIVVPALGQDWITQTPYPADNDLNDVFFLSAHEGWIVGEDNIVMRTVDGGETWSQHPDFVRDPQFFEDSFRQIEFVDAQHGFIGTNRDFYRTTDGGQTWQNLGFQGTTDSMDFVSPLLGFLSTNGGLRRTADGGDTFQNIFQRVSGVSFLNENLGLITSGGDVFQTTNGGDTWTMISQFGINDLLMIDQDIIIGTGINTNGLENVFRSDDGGVTWTLVQQTTSNFPAPAIIDNDSVAIVDTAYGVFLSNDNGASWNQTAPVIGSFGSAVRADFAPDGRTGYATGGAGIILKTVDGGQTWAQLSNGAARNLHDIVMLPTGLGLAVGEDGVLLRTTDFGLRWKASKLLVDNILTADLETVEVVDHDTFVVGGQLGGVFRSDDGGLNWAQLGADQNSIFGGNTIVFDIEFPNANDGWVFGQSNAPNGLIARTSDGGANWELLYSDVGIPRRAQMFDPQDGVALLLGEHFLTDDGFDTFDLRLLPRGNAESWVALHYTTPLVGWYGDAHGSILRTENGGLIFETQTLPDFKPGPPGVGDFLTDVHALSTTVAYAATYRPGSIYTGRIYQTTDGETWTMLDPLSEPTNQFAGLVKAIDVLPTGEIWATGGNGFIFASDVPQSAQPAELVDVNVAFGTLVSGGLAELLTSDDVDLIGRSQFGFLSSEPNVFDLRIGAETQVETPSRVDITVEARLNNPNGNVNLRLRNFNTGGLQSVHTYILGTTETRETASVTPAAQYVRDNDGRIELSMKTVVVATFSTSGFRAEVDQILITLR
ncbi:MAG: YCF48-related protein [Phycisphaerales bacterium]